MIQIYIVKKDDTIDKIINKFGIPYKKLEKLNPNINLLKLKVGTKLYIENIAHTILYKDTCQDM